MKHFTREQIEEIRIQLATKAVRDSDFDVAESLADEDLIPILQDGINKTAPAQLVKDNVINEIKQGVDGKVLSSNDYTDEEKEKLAGIAAGAQVNAPYTVVDPLYVHTDNNYTTPERTKLRDIAPNAQVNVIEGVKVNGSDLPLDSSKKVNVIVPDVSQFITKSVNDLINYYRKSEVYTKEEVDYKIIASGNFHYEVYASIQEVTQPAPNILYLIGPFEDETEGENKTDRYQEWVYSHNEWVQIGDTSIDLSDYITTAKLNTALASYQETLVSGTNIKTVNGQSIVGSGNLEVGDLNAIKFIAQTLTDGQKTQARTNIEAGTYSKPSGGIPKADLASGVQASLELADSAIQAEPVGSVTPAVDPYTYATKSEVSQLGQEVNGETFIETKTFSANGYVNYFTGLNIKQGDKIKIIVESSASWSSNKGWLIYNSEVAAPGLGYIDPAGSTYEITAPTDITSIGVRIYDLISEGNITLTVKTQTMMERVADMIDESAQEVESDLLSELDEKVNPVDLVEKIPLNTSKILSGSFSNRGFRINADGSTTTHQNYIISNAVLLQAGQSIFYKGFVGNTIAAIAIVNEESYSSTSTFTPVAVAKTTTDFEYFSYTAIQNCYVVLQCYKDYNSQVVALYCIDGSRASEIEKSVKSVSTELDSVKISTGFISPQYEIGNISITDSGWSYNPSTTRVRLKQGTTVALIAGDYIRIGEGIEIYVGWRKDGVYGRRGWIVGPIDYIAPISGDYVINSRLVPESTITDISAITDNISIIPKRSNEALVENIDNLTEKTIVNSNYDNICKAVAHRGLRHTYPENTIIGFKAARKLGFRYCETDIYFTSDNVAVLSHDATINRCARNADGTEISQTITIADVTYNDLLQYDFGIYMGAQFAGTKIPHLDDFLVVCHHLGLHPYLELKGGNETQIKGIATTVRNCGMDGNVTYIGYDTNLGYIHEVSPLARIGRLCESITESVINSALALKEENEVFISSASFTSGEIELCSADNIPLEVWGDTVGGVIVELTEQILIEMPSYITGATTDGILAGKVIYDANI